MLLYQRLLSLREQTDAAMHELLQEAVVFNLQNVADYYFAAAQTFWKIERDFPNLAPVYNVAWFEYQLPDKVVIGGEARSFLAGDKPAPAGLRYGYLAVSAESPEPGARWETVFSCFVGLGEKAASVAAWRMHIDETGQIATSAATGKPLFFAQPFHERQSTALLDSTSFLHPVLLGLSFLHCKNVDVIEAGGEKRTRTGKRKRHSIIRHHTLNIVPMQRVLAKEGRSETEGLSSALHICRGHFKDFSRGAGLFGKHRGLYWWESQVRGKAEHGEVRKDYNVNPPADE
jgi:hypothetical protein